MQLRIVPSFPFRSPLHGYRADLTWQGGEDGLIAHIVKEITPKKERGRCYAARRPE